MIDLDVHARIRRLFFAEHWKIGTIAAELGVHHETVRHAIEVDRITRGLRRARVRPSILDPYRDFIAETLDRHPRLRATRLFEMIQGRGYAGSAVQLRRHVATVRPQPKAEAFLLLRTLPGEQGQVDWGHFGKILIGRAQRALSCFVFVLGHSRAVFARFTLDQTLESFLRCHVLAFEALGVPREILYDNLKSVVVERVGDHIRFHPQILELAGHYHFAPKPCAPYRGNEKGKVERTIQYLRHSFFAARRFTSVEDLNRQLSEWIERVAHARPVPTDPDKRLVRDALAFERERLLPLPEHRFECDRVVPVSSGKQPYVRFDLNDYTIPHDQVRKPLTLFASETRIRIADAAGNVIATHVRSYDRGAVLEDPAHLEKLSAEKRRAHELRGRDRLRSSCPGASAWIEALAVRGEPIAAHTTKLGRLLETYGAPALDAALLDTLSRGAVSAAAVAQCLDQKRRAKKQPPQIPVVLPDDPRVRDLEITPHALTSYDALSDNPEENENGKSH
jgi:transposase